MYKRVAAVAVLLSLLAVALGQEKQIEKPPAKATSKTDDKQTSPPTTQGKAEPKTIIVARSQLPRNWSKLGLTKKQRDEAYKVRAAFAAKRQALLEQIEALKMEEEESLNKILTEDQRRQLAGVKK